MNPVDEMYTQLRTRALSATADELSVPDEVDVYGAIMEMDLGGAVVTLVCFGSGDASMYYSSGGGTIGGIGIPAVQAAALEMVDVFAHYADHLHPVDHANPPTAEKTSFIALTRSGLRAVSAPTSDIAAGLPVLTELFGAGQDVITGFRESAEQQSPPA